ncbi:hypothetical protein P170DRAFT_514616 [Aspergillus steynii IBT 23096]|uniref:Uncharacterized protein n=1 Tax=Aspergillus steynii IBT 23096 TaxID=1392250 RepID=A0A2I2FRX6_9EURO|nr:uncharacterized protein P170DRAFT_514616 [Aspergillus steynii IBT 23096]PLB43388.1 hypothetical protein P170DRAFT_514616 [Aspergillus steynii IBT 23096]
MSILTPTQQPASSTSDQDPSTTMGPADELLDLQRHQLVTQLLSAMEEPETTSATSPIMDLSDAVYRFDPFSEEAAKYDSDKNDDLINQINWEDPSSFFENLNLPRPLSYPSADEVRKESYERSTKVLSAWESLSKIVERHEDRIQKRWRQKSQPKRRQVLLAIWPDVPKMHRPDFHAFKRGLREEARDSYLWPYINLEDLEKPRPLLLFLNARGRQHPRSFVHADFNAQDLGHGSGVVRSAFLNLHTMMFTGGTTPETYGRLIPWGESMDNEAMRWASNGQGFHPGFGLLALEIQQRLYEFLLECCYQLLHDIPRESLIADFPVLPELTVKDEGDWTSLTAIAGDAPYRLPASLDLQSLEDLVDAKYSAAEDHLLALREDPGYFADVVNHYREHRQEILRDTNGKLHPTLNPYPHTLFWNRVLQNVVAEAYLGLETWDSLRALLTNLRQLQSKYADRISPEKDLPKEFYDELVKVRYFLEQLTSGPVGQLKAAVPASPPLRSLFEREPQIPGTSKMRVSSRPHRTMTDAQSELLWILETLWGDSRILQLAGRKTLMDILDRLVQSDPKNRDLISSRVAIIVSDLSVLSECLYQIELYHPSAATFESGFAGRSEEIRKAYAAMVRGWEKFLIPFEGTRLGDIGAPEKDLFYYPVEKRRNKQNVELMQFAERNLDAFWAVVDRHIPVKRGITRRNATYLALSRISGKLQRTADWVEPAKKPSQKKPFDQNVADRQFELEYRSEKTTDSSAPTGPKKKQKARGKAAVSETPVEPEPGLPPQVDTQPTFHVDKRSLKVFPTLFFQPSQTAQPGEVARNDFLYAMGGTAFSVQKLYGSVWQFTPRNLDVERSIQFHEPHPVAKIPFQYARRIGRRLSRTYGWHGGMFPPV